MDIDFGFARLHDAYQTGTLRAQDVVREVYRRIRARGEDHVWTELVDEEVAIGQARLLDAMATRAGARGALFGMPFSVKDNVDVAGMHTTCGCAGFDRLPSTTATGVARALAAGAILIGKNTLDQFATGLNGTRTVGGYCRNVFDARYVPGGSSSGSGVAVAAGLVSFALGSDTGGSGRVPAAMNNIVGVKPTVGLVSSHGMVWNNRYFDCMPVFARTVDDGYAVLDVIRGADPLDCFSRDSGAWATCIDVPQRFTFAIPQARDLQFFGDDAAQAAFAAAVSAMTAIGGEPVEIDFSLFIEAGRLPFDSGLLAERAVSYGDIVTTRPDTVHPAVTTMIQKGLAYSGTDTMRALYTMMTLRERARALFQPFAVLMTPTVGRAYTCAELEADPIRLNHNIGYYTYGISPLDLCALALPASMRADGLPFGVSLVAPAGADGLLRTLGTRFQNQVRLKPGVDQQAATLERSGHTAVPLAG